MNPVTSRLPITRLLRGIVIVIGLVLVSATASPAGDERVARLAQAMRMDEVFAVMAKEGEDYGRQLEEEMFPARGGARWQEAVRGIYAPDRLLAGFMPAFESALAQPNVDIDAMIDFFESDLGQRIVTLEISARRALLDPAVDDAARLKLSEMREMSDPRMMLIEEFVSANDLVEANVIGAMNASYAFYQGLAESGALPPDMDEGQILSEIWGQEDDIRAEMDDWIHSYLLMAYAPLSDEDIRRYTELSRSRAGQDLNRALFAGFDAVFVEVSRQLGRAAGAILTGQDL
ncbi:uncharacterized protein DUF2059 [Albidovulum inexpectatum]|uniref:Uncharacterized protein DUF2059 n=1 Tax=Albidovulum inexpectatum TaxID=196587 RepID=A0A2S5JEV9_9RHOB|nr:DUF2059 domain-containing protein [Albidovulum inexpectatum]PPB80037.1 uncharacterized protein DUF2059 [Albidovulum inexpectatum]